MSDKLNIKYISGCVGCPFCQMNDMSYGYQCQLKKDMGNVIKESKIYQPITPKWCPLKNEDILFKFKK